MQAWSKQGIVGRGVLLDYRRWAEARGKAPSPFSTHAIKLEELHEIAREQGVEFKFGDILFVRSGTFLQCTGPEPAVKERLGYVKEIEQKSKEELEAMAKAETHAFIGVEQGYHVLEWIWNNFSAVAGDHPSFECWRKTLRHVYHVGV